MNKNKLSAVHCSPTFSNKRVVQLLLTIAAAGPYASNTHPIEVTSGSKLKLKQLISCSISITTDGGRGDLASVTVMAIIMATEVSVL